MTTLQQLLTLANKHTSYPQTWLGESQTQIQAALTPRALAAEPGELSEIQHALRLAFHSLSLPRTPVLVATR